MSTLSELNRFAEYLEGGNESGYDYEDRFELEDPPGECEYCGCEVPPGETQCVPCGDAIEAEGAFSHE